MASPSLRIAEAQTLHDALQDQLFAPCLQAFFEQQKAEHMEMLLTAVRQSVRNTLNEARLAGMVEVYENAMDNLRFFAREELRKASQ